MDEFETNVNDIQQWWEARAIFSVKILEKSWSHPLGCDEIVIKINQEKNKSRIVLFCCKKLLNNNGRGRESRACDE